MNFSLNPTLHTILRLIALPLILLVIYLTMAAIWLWLGLPIDDALIAVVRGWFDHYGLWIVFVGALIEGFLLLGQYFPGSFIIFLGVISAGRNIPHVALVVGIVSLGFFIAYLGNYTLGLYGWHRLLVKFGLGGAIEKSKARLTSQGLNTIFFTYWEPNLASLTATAAGILQFPLRRFCMYSAAGIVAWNIVWGTLVYALGESALKLVGIKYIFIVFAVWVAVIVGKYYFWDRRRANK